MFMSCLLKLTQACCLSLQRPPVHQIGRQSMRLMLEKYLKVKGKELCFIPKSMKEMLFSLPE